MWLCAPLPSQLRYSNTSWLSLGVLPAHLSVKAAPILISEAGNWGTEILCHIRVTPEDFLRMTSQTLASSAPPLLSFPSGNTRKYKFFENDTLTEQTNETHHRRNSLPSTGEPWTGITLPRRPRREPEWWPRHSLSPGWQLPGWHQWVLEEAEPVGGVFLERAAGAGETSHAPRCFSEHHLAGRCQRQRSSLFLPEHVWVCLLLEKGYKRAAAVSGCSLSGHIVQIRLTGVKKRQNCWEERGFSLCGNLNITALSAWGHVLHLPADWVLPWLPEIQLFNYRRASSFL